MELVIFCLDFAMCFDSSNIGVHVAAFQFRLVLPDISAMNRMRLQPMPLLECRNWQWRRRFIDASVETDCGSYGRPYAFRKQLWAACLAPTDNRRPPGIWQSGNTTLGPMLKPADFRPFRCPWTAMRRWHATCNDCREPGWDSLALIPGDPTRVSSKPR